jgi:hypothetical protein
MGRHGGPRRTVDRLATVCGTDVYRRYTSPKSIHESIILLNRSRLWINAIERRKRVTDPVPAAGQRRAAGSTRARDGPVGRSAESRTRRRDPRSAEADRFGTCASHVGDHATRGTAHIVQGVCRASCACRPVACLCRVPKAMLARASRLSVRGSRTAAHIPDKRLYPPRCHLTFSCRSTLSRAKAPSQSSLAFSPISRAQQA